MEAWIALIRRYLDLCIGVGLWPYFNSNHVGMSCYWDGRHQSYRIRCPTISFQASCKQFSTRFSLLVVMRSR